MLGRYARRSGASTAWPWRLIAVYSGYLSTAHTKRTLIVGILYSVIFEGLLANLPLRHPPLDRHLLRSPDRLPHAAPSVK